LPVTTTSSGSPGASASAIVAVLPANAGGAVRLARAYQGQLTGATTLGEVAFGVERPLRRRPAASASPS
jgi:hypothetical protein